MNRPPAHVYARFGRALPPALERALPDRELVYWHTPEAFFAGIQDAEYLLALRPPRAHWARARRLRLLQCIGAGVDDVLPAPGLPERVAVANMIGMSAEPMGEYGLMLVLALLKGLPRTLAQQARREYRPFMPQTLAGKTLGILGLGAIGTALARRAHALGLRVIGTQRAPRPHPVAERVVPQADTAWVLAESDVVVVLLPLTDATRGLLDAALLAKAKPGARLINLARGGIVDEDALVAALRSGALESAALDVFGAEPLPESSPLWSVPNLLISPHIAGGFPEIIDEIARRYAENIARVEAGEPVRSPVDPARGY